MTDFSLLRRLRFVPRWAVVPTLRSQNVAEHSFHTLWIYAWLYDRYQFNAPSFYDALRVLAHDADEAISGDAPGPSKGPPNTEGASADKAWMKVADYLEAGLFLLEEQALGNTCLDPILDDLKWRGGLWVEHLSSFGWFVGVDGHKHFEVMLDDLWSEVSIHDHPGLRGL